MLFLVASIFRGPVQYSRPEVSPEEHRYAVGRRRPDQAARRNWRLAGLSLLAPRQHAVAEVGSAAPHRTSKG